MEDQRVVPSNDFRKELELENVSDEELMLRDQRIMARAMQTNHAQAGFRREMLEGSRIELADCLVFMQDQPYSPGLSELLESVQGQHAKILQILEQPDVSRADLVQLAALESAIDLEGLRKGGLPTVHISTLPGSAAEDVKSLIEDDGLPKSDESDDDIEEEEHEMVNPGAKSVKVQ